MSTVSATTHATQMSPARLAAEAAFSPPALPNRDSGDEPVVTVRQQKTLYPRATPDSHVERCSGSAYDESRTPRVFRIESATPQPYGDARDSAGTSSSNNAANEVVEAQAAPSAVSRKRRRRLHGDAKIVHPTHAQPVDAARPAIPDRGERLDQTARAAERSMPQIGFDIVAIRRRAEGEAARIKARIGMLERRAAAIRSKEAAKAVHWIKQAMAAYDLSLADLGL